MQPTLRAEPASRDLYWRCARLGRTLICPQPEIVVEKYECYLEMRLKIEAVFKHYSAQSELYKRANVAERLAMQDSFYQLSMELLSKIIGPFEITP
jgi:hypothetical protein